MLSTVLVLPALLALLGGRIERLSLPLLIRCQTRRGVKHRWYAFNHFVMRRAVVVLLTTAAVLLALGIPPSPICNWGRLIASPCPSVLRC